MFLANTPEEVADVLGTRFNEFLYGRRRFAKARVDFNPYLVSGYRLISAYEHRGLCAETDGMREKSIMPVDDVGNYVMACYELTLTEEGKQDFVPKDGKDYDPDSIVYVRIQLESNESIYREFTRSFASSTERLDRVLEVEREAEKLKREYEEKLRGCASELAGAMKQLDADDYGC